MQVSELVKYFEYLDALDESGTNMFQADAFLTAKFKDLGVYKAQKVQMAWMETSRLAGGLSAMVRATLAIGRGAL